MKPETLPVDTSAGNKPGRRERGIILFVVLFVATVASVYVGSLLSTANAAAQSTRRWKAQDQCLLAAQSVLDAAVYDVNEHFRVYFKAVRGWDPCVWFENSSTSSVGSSSPATLPAGVNKNGYTVTVTRLGWTKPSRVVRSLTFKAVATGKGAQKTIVQTVDFGLKTAGVFDYMVFLNNGGSANAIGAINGDIHTNGDFTISNLTISGIFSASQNPELNDAGLINGTVGATSLQSYINSSAADSNNRARPTNPPDTTKAKPDDWPMGYDGVAQKQQGLPVVDMPYLGDLQYYKDEAKAYNGGKGGTIKYKSGSKNVTITAVYGDEAAETGPDGVASTPDDGMLVITGDATNPITIDGPVVINNDVVIKGVVTGQGVIYSGRNVHVIGDVIYKNPPNWTRQDANPTATATTNGGKDLLCLAAQGNVVLGNYADSGWYSTVSNGLNTGQSYATDPADIPIGYKTSGTAAAPTFNGNYTANDGGKRINSSGAVATTRAYYQSSNDKAFAAATPAISVNKLDAVIFTNHCVMGFAGNGSTPYVHNGARVSRDKAIYAYNNSAYKYNWDIRVGSYSRDSLGVMDTIVFPKSLREPTIKYWREGAGE